MKGGPTFTVRSSCSVEDSKPLSLLNDAAQLHTGQVYLHFPTGALELVEVPMLEKLEIVSMLTCSTLALGIHDICEYVHDSII